MDPARSLRDAHNMSDPVQPLPPGDPRYVDWNVYARLGDLVVKRDVAGRRLYLCPTCQSSHPGESLRERTNQ